MRLLHGRIQHLRVLYVKMLAVQRYCFTRHCLAPYLKKFFRHFITLIVREKNSVAQRLVWIASSHDIDQQPSPGEPVERRRHSWRRRGRRDGGTNRDQELESGRHRNQG